MTPVAAPEEVSHPLSAYGPARSTLSSGKFSSDRTTREYAEGIWNAMPCPVV